MPPAFTTKLEELRTSFEIYDIELAQERRPSSEQLQQADESRDYTVRKLHQLIKDFSDYRFDTEKEQAAKSLLTIFKRYGTGSKIARLSQDSQTAVITNLLQELARDEVQQHEPEIS